MGITDLEDIVSGFPINMLVPDTPCISDIRLALNNTNPKSPSLDNSPPNPRPLTSHAHFPQRLRIRSIRTLRAHPRPPLPHFSPSSLTRARKPPPAPPRHALLDDFALWASAHVEFVLVQQRV